MPNTVLTIANVKSETAIALGGEGVDIELVEVDYEKCLKDALRVYNRNRPMQGNAAITITAAQRKYGPLNTIHPGLQGILTCEFITGGTGSLNVFDQLGNNLSQSLAAANGLPFGEIDQQLQYVEMSRRIVSSEPEWRAGWEGANYYLYIDSVQPGLLCSYLYSFHATPDDNANTGMQLLPDGDTDWIMAFTLARAKQILARKRGKFQGIMNPDGGTDAVDWSELRDEGREDEGKLIEEIQARRRPLPPVIE